MLSRFSKNKTLAGFGIGSIIALLCVVGNLTGLFHSLHETFSNSLYTRNEPIDDIVIIEIDEKSTQPLALNGLGRFSQWSRELYVELLDILKKENPKVITFDILFHTNISMIPKEKLGELSYDISAIDSNKEKLEKYEEFVNSYKYEIDNPIDKAFAAKLQEFDNIILSSVYNSETGMIKPLSEFAMNATLGLANAPLDKSGVIRYLVPTIDLGDESYDHLALATAKKFAGVDDFDIPLEGDRMLANYFGDPNSFQMISFVDVLNGEYSAGMFKDKMVIIGVTSPQELHDEYYTPRDNTMPMAGVEIISNQIQTILEGKFLTNQSSFSQILTLLILAIALTIALNYLGALLSTAAAIAAILIYIAAAHFFYCQGIIVNMIYPFAAIILSYLSSWVYKYFIADKSKREIKGAFGRYVSKELVEEIAKNPEMAKLGGEKRVVTVFFSDLAHSTTISESAEITSWVSQLNEYFTAMEKVIKHFGGTIDKYEGDAIMAFWNAPVLQEDHTDRAYKAALEMKALLAQLNKKWTQEGRPELNFRIGINTGEVIVGNIGSRERFNYTVMGDTVNTASRLESSANKVYGTISIVSGLTEGLSERFLLREIDTVLLPGKNDPIVIYELVAAKNQASSEQFTAVQTYMSGLAAYRRKDFTSAIAEFIKCLSDPAAKVMLERCQKLQKGENVAGLDGDMIFKIVNK